MKHKLRMNGKLNKDEKKNLLEFKKKIEEQILILEGLDNEIDLLTLKRNDLLGKIETNIILYRKFKYNNTKVIKKRRR